MSSTLFDFDKPLMIDTSLELLDYTIVITHVIIEVNVYG